MIVDVTHKTCPWKGRKYQYKIKRVKCNNDAMVGRTVAFVFKINLLWHRPLRSKWQLRHVVALCARHTREAGRFGNTVSVRYAGSTRAPWRCRCKGERRARDAGERRRPRCRVRGSERIEWGDWSAFEIWRVKMTSDGWNVTYQHMQLE